MSAQNKFSSKCKIRQILFFYFLVTSFQINAAPLSLETAPLFTTNSVKPNLILAIDDSGSMDSEVLFPTNDGALWWNTTNQSFVSAGNVTYNVAGSASGVWNKYTYLFPNGTGSGNRVYSDSTNHHFAIPPFKQYAFARSSEYNKMYYDPNVTYSTWVDYDTTNFNDIAVGSAPSDPISGSTTLDLVTDLYLTSSNSVFKVFNGMKIPAGTYYDHLGAKTLATSDVPITGTINLGIQYYPATYYTTKTSGTYTVGIPANIGDCSTPLAAHFETFHNQPSSLSGTNVDSLGPEGQCLTKTEIKSTILNYPRAATRTDCSSITCSYTEEAQNFANWYSYYRKRHLALRAGMGQAFFGFGAIRTGIFTINHRSNVTMWDMDSTSDTFFSHLYAIDGNSGGTPNRQAMEYAGQQFMRTGGSAPITSQCQKNFTLLFTDGFASLGGIPSVGNQDGGKGSPYQDGHPNTIADIAWKYYETNLNPSLTTGEVPKALGCSATPVDPLLDCNGNLHMNTFTVGLGATGTIFNVTHNSVADAYTTPPVWPNPNSTRDATQVDDLYHAAVNGRGEMFNATSASDLQEQLKRALLGIQASIGVSSAVTFNTATLETDSAVFFAFFNSSNWSGDLLSFELGSTGDISLIPDWSAASILQSATPNARTIITHNGSDGIPFRWDTAVLSAAQQADLNTASGGNGENALNFIRGVRTNEGPGEFRVRGNIMGDIVNAAPIFVGTPNLGWPSSAPFPIANKYSDFRAGLLSTPRTSVVYVGANDGMLHGFNTSNGNEILAYIPGFTYSSSATKGLHYLTNPNYSHQYYVDLAPTVSDVFINTGSGNAWHTVLIGGGRSGGRGLFALDITAPSSFSEANADDIALWEFTHAELGYTYSKPTVVMMNNGKWAAIFGNGYNNTGSGKAKLFILYLDGGLDGTWTAGTDYFIISTEKGSTGTPNGLATPAIVDLDKNGTADRAYAGDLEGNMWAFDLSSVDPAITPWSVAYSASGSPAPLFIAEDSSSNRQPITQKPVVAFHPDPPTGGSHNPNIMVFFGTGKFLEATDITSTDQHSFYGVWDEGSENITRSNLVEQTFDLVSYTDTNGDELRLISDNAVNYNSNKGWFFDFSSTGERSVVDPQIRGSLVFFNTWIPSSSECDSGGSGFLMSVEMLNGGEPDSSIFDTDGTAGVDNNDKVNDGITNRVAIGQAFNNGLPAQSSFLSNKQYTPGTGDTSIHVRELAKLAGETGRLSWKQLQ